MSIYDQILEEEKRLLEKEKPAKKVSPYQAILDEEASLIEASNIKREYVEQGGKPEDVYSPERAKVLMEQGPEALMAEPPLRREDGSIAGPTIPTEEALAKGLIEKKAEPAVQKAMNEGVNTVSSGYDQEKGVGFAVGRDKDGKVVRVEKKPERSIYQKILNEERDMLSSLPDSVPDEKLSPRESAVARESLGRFAKGALVTGPAALARTYGLAESALGIPIKGEPYPFEATAGARIAQGIEQAGERLYPTIPEAQGSFIPEVAGGLGQVSTLPILGPAARAVGVPARAVPRAAAAGAGVVLGAGEGAQRASQAGAKPEEVLTSGFLSGATGLSEIFPTERWIEKIDKATAGKFSRDVRRYFIDMGIEGGTEALQEGFQQVMGNLIAKGQYRPEQDVFEGAGRAALVGGTVGTIASGVIGGFGLSQARKAEARAQTPVQAEATNEPQAQNALQEEQAQPREQVVMPEQEIPSFEEFSQTRSNFSVPEKIEKETFKDDFGEINVSELWKQVSENRPQPVRVPREYIMAYSPYIKTQPENVKKANPSQIGLAEFVRNHPTDKNYVGIRLIDGWHRAVRAAEAGTDFYAYPVETSYKDDSRNSTIRNAYDFAAQNNAFYGTSFNQPQEQTGTISVTRQDNKYGSLPPSEPPPPAQPPPQPAPAPQPAPEPRPTIRQRLKEGLDNFRRTFQDKFVDVENLQKRVGKGATSLPDAVNIKQSEELFHGRVGERLTNFEDTQVNPIIEDLRQTGIEPAIFEQYAIAKHARERNAVIADRNPQMPDGGSGMTNAEADRLLAGGIPLDVQARLEPIRQRLLAINQSTISNLLEGGLISQETFDLLTKRYKDYVPLRGTKNRGVDGGTEFEAARITGTGSGLDVRGRDIIRAEGRESMANDILAYAVSQNMDSVVRSEKNRVLQTAARFATAFPDNGVIENVKPSEVMKTISYAEDGQTRFARIIDPNLADAPDIVAYKENGEAKYLRINDPRLADVMKNRESPVLGSVIERLGSLMRYFAFINTQASPEFVISNFARDLQTALVNINSDQAQGLARDLLKNIRPALKATYRAELGKPDQGSRMDVFYRQFKAAGGRMTFFGLKDFQALQKQIQSKLAGGGSNAATRVFRLALDRVGQLNGAVENATRLATFATLKERGFTDQQAAYAARNITVNFTRKGTAGPLLNAVYLFFNANIQGSARIIQALATSKKAQKLVLGVMVAGFFRDILNRIIGGEDETGMPLYDKIPEYQRRQNFIIMNPLAEEMGVQYFKLPMPYGYSVFDFAGQLVGDVMPREIYGGGKSPMQAATSLALAAIDNFNPIGGSYSILQALSPTILTPVADLALNQDFSGRPIMPTPNPFDPVPPPDSQRYWNNVNPASKWVTEKINELTGGSRARAGAIDVSPETLDYSYEFLAGAVGKFGERVMMAPIRAAKVAAGQEDAVDLIGDIPMVRKVTGSVPSFVDVKRYQDVRKEILTIDKELKLAKQERDTEKVREILRDAKPELRLVNMVKATEQDLKELRTQKRKLQEMDKNRTNPAIQKRLDANRERQKALMIKTLERYNSSIDDKM